MNALINLDLKYKKKKIILGKTVKRGNFNFFFPKKIHSHQVEEKISLGFPGYPEIIVGCDKKTQITTEQTDVDFIKMGLYLNKKNKKKKASFFFVTENQEENFFISKKNNQEIKKESDSSQIINPYALFCFQEYMKTRFNEFKDELVITQQSELIEKKSSLMVFLIPFFQNTKDVCMKVSKKTNKIIEKEKNILLSFFVILIAKLSGLTFLFIWNFILPFILLRMLYRPFIEIWKKASKFINFEKLKTQFNGIYQEFIILEIFFNGLIRTGNILSV